MTDGEAETESPLSPDDAFALLGNETRVAILRTLGDARDPLPFSDLHDRIDVRDSGQFNYHLEKLVGHFVRKTEDGYTLSRMGRRVVEAVLSGAVTETPELERTVVDESCEYCGAPVEVTWKEGNIRLFCTECSGRYGRAFGDERKGTVVDEGYLGRLPLPPAGVRDRSPTEVFQAAWIAGTLEVYSLAAGICPRCSATVDRTVDVCEDHDASDGPCGSCRSVYAVKVGFRCSNCIYEGGGGIGIGLVASTELLDFVTDHGRNPINPDSIRAVNSITQDYDVAIHSTDPLRVGLTYTIGEDSLSLTVDEELNVLESTR
ncbi:MAG: helix-turn-helix domain-containing protein [Haloarculaceae archaeon]